MNRTLAVPAIRADDVQAAGLQRQCACGNHTPAGSLCAACRQVRGKLLQAKLSVGAAGDSYEQEADQVADRILAVETGSGDGLPRIRRLVREAAPGGAAPPSVMRTLAEPGRSLERELRSDMERRFGCDFSRVRVHSGPLADQSSRELSANAYTVGRDVVFGAGRFAPETREGRRLIAHELTHVVQQSGGSEGLTSTRRIQRDLKPAAGTAGAAPKLQQQDSVNGAPCACLLVIHNNERKARRTAQAMHKHCSYNLLLMEPDSGDRELGLQCIAPGRSQHPKDPNECFPPEIAEQCINDEAGCRKYLIDNATSKKAADIRKFMQMSFFLAIKDCSKGFSLPVVALHNNDIEDTRRYLDKKDTTDLTGLKQDVDKSKKETGADRVEALRKQLDAKFGTKEFEVNKQKTTIRKLLMDTAGKTNIFRWCSSNALSKCHIGDPANPDRVIWVTNAKDFDALSKKDVNVALQSDAASAAGTDAETDLSTLFPVVQEKLGAHFDKIIAAAQAGAVKDLDEILRFLRAAFASEAGGASDESVWMLLLALLRLHLRVSQAESAAKRKQALADIRYLNIETPHNLPGKTDVQVATENYEFIAAALKEAGLHCCGKDTPQAQKNIKKELEDAKAY